MNAADIRSLYGKPANRTAMLDAIEAMKKPHWSGVLYIPNLPTGDFRDHPRLMADAFREPVGTVTALIPMKHDEINVGYVRMGSTGFPPQRQCTHCGGTHSESGDCGPWLPWPTSRRRAASRVGSFWRRIWKG